MTAQQASLDATGVQQGRFIPSHRIDWMAQISPSVVLFAATASMEAKGAA
jgi:hypothetical protein